MGDKVIFPQGIQLKRSYSPDDVEHAVRRLEGELGGSVIAYIRENGPATVRVELTAPFGSGDEVVGMHAILEPCETED